MIKKILVLLCNLTSLSEYTDTFSMNSSIHLCSTTVNHETNKKNRIILWLLRIHPYLFLRRSLAQIPSHEFSKKRFSSQFIPKGTRPPFYKEDNAEREKVCWIYFCLVAHSTFTRGMPLVPTTKDIKGFFHHCLRGQAFPKEIVDHWVLLAIGTYEIFFKNFIRPFDWNRRLFLSVFIFSESICIYLFVVVELAGSNMRDRRNRDIEESGSDSAQKKLRDNEPRPPESESFPNDRVCFSFRLVLFLHIHFLYIFYASVGSRPH